MKYFRNLSLAMLLASILGIMVAFISTEKPKSTPSSGFAVVELFTSEGCSSCPPAEELMARLQYEYKGKEVYLLAYHIDYFDRLGWKDTFSKPEHTKRQVQYSKWLRGAQVYTPQAIINGKHEYIGSDESVIRPAIRRELAGKKTLDIYIKAKVEKNSLVVDYQMDKFVKDTQLAIALVQKTAKVAVKSGENAGRELFHIQIVQQLKVQAIAAEGKGSVSFTLPKTFDANQWEVLGLVQYNSTGEIIAAKNAGF